MYFLVLSNKIRIESNCDVMLRNVDMFIRFNVRSDHGMHCFKLLYINGH